MNEGELFTGTVSPPENVIPPETELAHGITTGVNAFLGLVGGLAVIALIISGIIWSLAAGDEEKILRAKKIFLTSLIGLTLVLSAWGIARIVIGIFAS